MSKKIDVEVSLHEVMDRLNENGAMRKALVEVANEKAAGQEIGDIKLVSPAGGELSNDDLDAVAGGAVRVGSTGGLLSAGATLNYGSLTGGTGSILDKGGLAAADTRW